MHPAGRLVGLVPQSQASPVSVIPLPHTAFVQTLGDPVQLQPGSIRQVEEQPSSGLLGALLPVSHCLPSSTTPSPQVGSQGFPATRQVQPDSSWHVDEQPSPLTVLPSSHCLLVVNMPLPQTPRYWQGCPAVGQVQLASIWQSALQPSSIALDPVFLAGGTPSSHCSPGPMTPSPQDLLKVTPPPELPLPAKRESRCSRRAGASNPRAAAACDTSPWETRLRRGRTPPANDNNHERRKVCLMRNRAP